MSNEGVSEFKIDPVIVIFPDMEWLKGLVGWGKKEDADDNAARDVRVLEAT